MSSYNVNGISLSPAVSGQIVSPSQYNNKILALQQILDLATQLYNNVKQCSSQFNSMKNAINSLKLVSAGNYITADIINDLISAINSVYDFEQCLISYYNSEGIYPSIPSILPLSPVQKGQLIVAYSWNNWNNDIYNEFESLTLLPFLFIQSESVGFISPSPSINALVTPSPQPIQTISPPPSISKQSVEVASILLVYDYLISPNDNYPTGFIEISPTNMKFIADEHTTNYNYGGSRVAISNSGNIIIATDKGIMLLFKPVFGFVKEVSAYYEGTPTRIISFTEYLMQIQRDKSYVTFFSPIDIKRVAYYDFNYLLEDAVTLSGNAYFLVDEESLLVLLFTPNWKKYINTTSGDKGIRSIYSASDHGGITISGESGYIYVVGGISASSGGKLEITKIDPSTYSLVRSITIPINISKPQQILVGQDLHFVSLVPASGYLYLDVGYSGHPLQVAKIDMATMQVVKKLSYSSYTEYAGQSLFFEGNLYIPLITDPAKILMLSSQNLDILKIATPSSNVAYGLYLLAPKPLLAR